MNGLLGNGPSRKFKIFREEFPAIFRFNGMLFMEQVAGDGDTKFVEVSEGFVLRQEWLEAKKPCEDKNSNVCVAEGCYGEACIKKPRWWDGEWDTLEDAVREVAQQEVKAAFHRLVSRNG